MPRLFTGIAIPDEIRQRLALLRGGLRGARWIDADNYHLTLRFVGDIDGRTADEIADRLARVARPAFALTIEGLGAFGGRKPHAIVAEIAGGLALAELQAEHERIMQRLGLAADPRRYVPHITFARLGGAAERDVADYLALRGSLRAGPFAVEEFILFSSRDSVGGGPYVVEAAYPLKARAA